MSGRFKVKPSNKMLMPAAIAAMIFIASSAAVKAQTSSDNMAEYYNKINNQQAEHERSESRQNQINQQYQPSYNPPPYGPNGYNIGAQGYDGITGQVDRTYIPTGTDPNPPPNIMGR